MEKIKDLRLANYVRELGNVLETLDVEKYKQFIIDHMDVFEKEIQEGWKIMFERNSPVVEISMYKCAANRTDLSKKTIAKARKWLKEHNYSINIKR